MITSTANVQVKELIRLMKKGRARNEAGVFLVEGPRMTGELTSDPAWRGKTDRGHFRTGQERLCPHLKPLSER